MSNPLTPALLDVIQVARARAETIVQQSARITALEADVDSYRTLAQQSLHALHALTVQQTKLRAQYRRSSRRFVPNARRHAGDKGPHEHRPRHRYAVCLADRRGRGRAVRREIGARNRKRQS